MAEADKRWLLIGIGVSEWVNISSGKSLPAYPGQSGVKWLLYFSVAFMWQVQLSPPQFLRIC